MFEITGEMKEDLPIYPIQWSAVITQYNRNDNAYTTALTETEHWYRLVLTKDTPSYGVYIMRISEKTDCVLTAPLYIGITV